MSIIEAINEVCDVVSLDRFDTLVGNSNPNAQTMIEFAQQAGEEIARRGDWNRTLKSASVDASPFPLPENFQRLIAGGGIQFGDGRFARLVLNSGEWLIIKTVSSSQPFAFIQAGKVEFTSADASSGATINYVSRNWLVDGSDERDKITSDDNNLLFPDRLLTKGVIWRWRRQKGMTFDDQVAEFEADLAMELSADRGASQ
jgi:hypothetical protein